MTRRGSGSTSVSSPRSHPAACSRSQPSGWERFSGGNFLEYHLYEQSISHVVPTLSSSSNWPSVVSSPALLSASLPLAAGSATPSTNRRMRLRRAEPLGQRGDAPARTACTGSRVPEPREEVIGMNIFRTGVFLVFITLAIRTGGRTDRIIQESVEIVERCLPHVLLPDLVEVAPRCAGASSASTPSRYAGRRQARTALL